MHSVDPSEIQNFSAHSDRWWDENGPFKPLHKLNPVRVSYIRQQILKHFDRKLNLKVENPLNALKNIEIIDIGCGGGLVCEPLSRLGANVTGLDADKQAIETARAHAKAHELNIDYQALSSEDFLKNHKKKFDVVLALEIIEHVSDIPFFIENCAKLLKPGGLLIFSTLNRTPKSFALGIVAVEYILHWLPQGTHRWKKFVKPSELAGHLKGHGFQAKDITGLVYQPLKDEFSLSKTDIAVNYFLCSSKMKNREDS